MVNPDGAEFLAILEEIIGDTAKAISSVDEWQADAEDRGDEELVEFFGRLMADMNHYGGATQDRMMNVLRRMMGPMSLFSLAILLMLLWPKTGSVVLFVPLLLFGA